MNAIDNLSRLLRSPLVATTLCRMLVYGEMLVELRRGWWAPIDKPLSAVGGRSVNVMIAADLVDIIEIDVRDDGEHRPVRRRARAVRLRHPVREHLHAAAMAWVTSRGSTWALNP